MSWPVDTCPVCGGPDYVPHDKDECAVSILQRQRDALEAARDALNAANEANFIGHDFNTLEAKFTRKARKAIRAIDAVLGKEPRDD
jgi:hypothetical protein